MLSTFDWIRTCRDGAELLATLELLRNGQLQPQYSLKPRDFCPPLTLWERPCMRCMIYAPARLHRPWLCCSCLRIVGKALEEQNQRMSRQMVMIWGNTNHIPRMVQQGAEGGIRALGQYVMDESQFLLVLHRKDLIAWLQDFAIYDGDGLRGSLQIFSFPYNHTALDFSSLFTLITALQPHKEIGRLFICFHPKPFYILQQQLLEQIEQRIFSLAEAIELLQLVRVLHHLFSPLELEQFRDLIRMENGQERQFYWGRFIGNLSPEARLFLETQQMRQWTWSRLKFLNDIKSCMVDISS